MATEKNHTIKQAYKAVLRNGTGSTYLSIWAAKKGAERFGAEGFTWELGVTQTSPGGASHGDYLFAYPVLRDALDYATKNAPNGDIAILVCDVEGKLRGGKLFCTRITPIREIPVRRDPSAPHSTFSAIAGGRAPVKRVAGNQAPTLKGHSYYWTTPSGRTIVEHPNAYGWPTLYHHSTRRIEVGEHWAPLVVDRDAIYSCDNH